MQAGRGRARVRRVIQALPHGRHLRMVKGDCGSGQSGSGQLVMAFAHEVGLKCVRALDSQDAEFAEICALTDMFEGSIIRATRRLDEVMVQIGHAASVVGDETLAGKFEQARATIRRDAKSVMFGASLYL